MCPDRTDTVVTELDIWKSSDLLERKSNKMEPDFDKLVSSLTKQQQRRHDLEVSIKKADARKKAVDGELVAMRSKDETLSRQLPELEKEIVHYSALCASKQADLRQLQNGCSKLEGNLASTKEKVSLLQERNEREHSENASFHADVAKKLNDNLANLERACDATTA